MVSLLSRIYRRSPPEFRSPAIRNLGPNTEIHLEPAYQTCPTTTKTVLFARDGQAEIDGFCEARSPVVAIVWG